MDVLMVAIWLQLNRSMFLQFVFRQLFFCKTANLEDIFKIDWNPTRDQTLDNGKLFADVFIFINSFCVPIYSLALLSIGNFSVLKTIK